MGDLGADPNNNLRIDTGGVSNDLPQVLVVGFLQQVFDNHGAVIAIAGNDIYLYQHEL